MLLENLVSDRLRFRSLRASDYEHWLPFVSDTASIRYLDISGSPEKACRDWITRQQSRYRKDGFGLCALEHLETGEFVGQCGLIRQLLNGKEEVEIGYSLLRPFYGKGYATEAASCCKNFAFANNVAPSLVSIVHENNTASQQVALRNGMRPDKKLTYHNLPVIVYRVYST